MTVYELDIDHGTEQDVCDIIFCCSVSLITSLRAEFS